VYTKSVFFRHARTTFLLGLLIISFSGCSEEPKVITVDPNVPQEGRSAASEDAGGKTSGGATEKAKVTP
jgi:hypothetical protein